MADIHGIAPRRAVLQEAIGKPAGGCSEIHGDQSADIELKMFQSFLQFESAAADITFGSFKVELIGWLYQVARLAGWLAIDGNLAGHDRSLRFFAAFA